MNLRNKLRPIALATSMALASMAAPLAAHADVTGNISVVSQYILRGITNAPENPNATLQGGFDWSGDSGLYAGYWGSTLGYNNGDPSYGDGFENDLYVGYAGGSTVKYSIGVIQYMYMNLTDSNGAEIAGTLGYGPLTLGAKYLTKDVVWGNKGDIYWTLGYSTDLPKDFSLSATAGYYTYKDSGKYIASTPKSGNFRHLDVTLSHPIAKTGATMNVTYTVGGKDRNEVEQHNAIVFGIGYNFGI